MSLHCEGWTYRNMDELTHLYKPGSHVRIGGDGLAIDPSLCGRPTNGTLMWWSPNWGEPDTCDTKYARVCPECRYAYISLRDGPSIEDLRREAIAIVREELGEAVT